MTFRSALLCAILSSACAHSKDTAPSATPTPDSVPAATPVTPPSEKVALTKRVASFDLYGVPIHGDMQYAVDLTAPNDDRAHASGTILFQCGACTLGDGATKVKLPFRAQSKRKRVFSEGGFTVPALQLGSARGRIVLHDGKGTISLRTQPTSDLQARITGTIQLAKELDDTQLDLTVELVPGAAVAAGKGKPFLLLAATVFLGSAEIEPVSFYVKGTVERPRIIAKPRPRTEPADQGPKKPPLGAPQPTGPVPMPNTGPPIDIPRADFAKHVGRGAGGAITVTRDLVRWLGQHPKNRLDGARLVPLIRGGKRVGFKVFVIRPGTLLALLGFENGDSVTQLDGIDLVTEDRIRLAYTGLLRRSTSRVVLTRRGRIVELVFDIRP